MAFVRNYSRYSADVVLHRNFDAFLDEPVRSGINVIDCGQTLLELHIQDRNAATTLVVFHAAADLSQTSLPLFTGERLTEGSEANVVFVSDPSLERGSSIGWFTGDVACPLQTDLVNVLSKIQKDLNAHNLIFYGSSAGGFASLYYSHCFPDSLAIVSNPQTDIAQYLPAAVSQYLDKVWNVKDISDVPAVTDLIPLYQQSFPNYVAYLINESDDFHNDNHLAPWAAATENEPEHRRFIVGDWGEGHASPPVYVLKGVVDFAISVDGNWSEFFSDEDFSATYSL
ncbi:hypothetical protein ACL1EU_06205 [Corynebacterium striatum]